MKRSEMLQKLSDALRISRFAMTTDKQAEYVLEIVEQAGMLPPSALFREDFGGNGRLLETESNEWENE